MELNAFGSFFILLIGSVAFCLATKTDHTGCPEVKKLGRLPLKNTS